MEPAHQPLQNAKGIRAAELAHADVRLADSSARTITRCGGSRVHTAPLGSTWYSDLAQGQAWGQSVPRHALRLDIKSNFKSSSFSSSSNHFRRLDKQISSTCTFPNRLTFLIRTSFSPHFTMLASTTVFILSFLSPMALSAPALVPRRCYMSGIKWDPITSRFGRDTASAAVDELCVPSKLSGVYHGDQKKTACIELTPGRTAEFSIEYLGPDRSQIEAYKKTITDVDCRVRLRDEIYGCKRGGETMYDRFDHYEGQPFIPSAPNLGEWTFR